MSGRGKRGAAAAAAAAEPKVGQLTPESDEQEGGEEDEAYDPATDEHQPSSPIAIDDEDDEQPKQAASAAAAKQQQQKPREKLSKWTLAEDQDLLAAILSYVEKGKGQLPSPIVTRKGAPIPKQWKEIAAEVAKVGSMKNADEQAKACSLRWASLRSSLKVSSRAQTLHQLMSRR
jgi:hypothetical protein